ncbi:MAG: peptidoglycan-associated outer membrane lipoprotein Pal [Candidatus Westeberhardia cardiocondylae]|nr:peptidoglycan-associated outer membrane lipoprotein Pal [Candidatus Westeberhardia cardiocondylae]
MKIITLLKKIFFAIPFIFLTSCDSYNKNIHSNFNDESISSLDEKQEFDFIDENENNFKNSLNISSILNKLQYNNTVYFDLDKYVIRPEFFNMLNEYAEFLLNHPSYSIIVEGHTDERGTSEYNISLGKRRSNAIKEYLENRGVSSDQINIVSYGKEKLASLGHDEFSHAKNRRTVNLLKKCK